MSLRSCLGTNLPMIAPRGSRQTARASLQEQNAALLLALHSSMHRVLRSGCCGWVVSTVCCNILMASSLVATPISRIAALASAVANGFWAHVHAGAHTGLPLFWVTSCVLGDPDWQGHTHLWGLCLLSNGCCRTTTSY